MNRLEAIRNLKPFFDFVFSVPVSAVQLPMLREFAALGTGKSPADKSSAPARQSETIPADAKEAGILKRRIHRRYLRLCRLQQELIALDLKKAQPGVSLEDFTFSRIDFSRYREIDEAYFHAVFSEGLTDFDEAFCKKQFGLEKAETQKVIEESYTTEEGRYKLRRENPLVLSIMRTLEISLEDGSLFTPEEIRAELEKLSACTGKPVPAADTLFPLFAARLDHTIIAHGDGMTTKLFISPEGDLRGIFRPGDKPWTRILIPAEQIKPKEHA